MKRLKYGVLIIKFNLKIYSAWYFLISGRILTCFLPGKIIGVRFLNSSGSSFSLVDVFSRDSIIRRAGLIEKTGIVIDLQSIWVSLEKADLYSAGILLE